MLDTLLAPQHIHFLRPHTPAPDGLTLVLVDLPSFFELIPRVGRAGALLLLTLKALRQRAAHSPESTAAQLALSDLTWVLRATPRQVRRWLHRLSTQGLLVYALESRRGTATLTVEFVPEPIRPPRFSADPNAPDFAPPLELPSHWIVSVLPRIGRTAFLVYLYVLGQEPAHHGPATLSLDALSTRLNLWGRSHATLALWWLRRFHLLVRHPRGTGLIVRDPRPLTRVQRFVLHCRAHRRWPRTRTQILGLLVLLLGVVTFVVLATHRS